MAQSTKRLSLLPTPKNQEELLKFLDINFKRIIDILAQQIASGDIADGSILLQHLYPGIVFPDSMLDSIQADKVTGGTLQDGYLLGGNIRTGDSPAPRVVFDSDGLVLIDKDQVIQFALYASLGQLYIKALGEQLVNEAQLHDQLVLGQERIESLPADKLTEGRLEDGYLLAGNIRTADSGLRTVFDSLGLHLYDVNGEVLKPNIQVFTSSGTWTKPFGAKWVRAMVQAAGGGGGAADGAASQVAAGGGGGGGGFGEAIYRSDELGESEAVTVGTGGTAGATPSGTGGTGNTSSFAGISALGGVGGVGGGSTANDAPGNQGGLGGTSSGGQFNIPGGDGGWGLRLGVIVQGLGGYGGASRLGGSTRSAGPTGAAGNTGKNYGGGGGGGIADNATDRAGGAGAPGLVIVITHFA